MAMQGRPYSPSTKILKAVFATVERCGLPAVAAAGSGWWRSVATRRAERTHLMHVGVSLPRQRHFVGAGGLARRELTGVRVPACACYRPVDVGGGSAKPGQVGVPSSAAFRACSVSGMLLSAVAVRSAI